MKKYRVNEIFFSLQGEGFNTGRAAVFIRFAGCNMHCPFCDTKFDTYTEMTAEEILSQPQLKDVPCPESTLVVLTGGEPTLQVDSELVKSLKGKGFEVAMESNGTLLPPPNIDWLTLSPKTPKIVYATGTSYKKELKIVFTGTEETNRFLKKLEDTNENLMDFYNEAQGLYLQPCDTGNPERNVQIMNECIEYIKYNPEWTLSLQTHKLIGIK
jgi:organic radical activating enzyme